MGARTIFAMLGSFTFDPWEPTHWAGVAMVSILIGIGKWSLGKVMSSQLFAFAGYIDPGFAPYEKLDQRDLQYICANCVITTSFFYHFLGYLHSSPRVSWSLQELTVWNTLVSTLLQFTLYDFFYHGFHRTLHLGSIYPYIHKHHHKQKAPTRGVMDGINVHPFEMAVGIYLHLFVVAVIPCHIVGAQLFFGMASLMAGFNHTRWGIYVPKFYDVRDHDMHHVYPNCNYAQYVMWWDKLFGCFKESPTSRPPLKKKI